MGVWTNGYYSISGAGVIIVEKYTKKNGKHVYCIVLAKNKCSHEYSDFGGSYEEKHNNPRNTAKMELLEESRNMLNIDSKYLNNYYDIPAGRHEYRVYLLKINNIRRKIYIHNMRAMSNNVHIKRRWTETDDITHIPIFDMNIDINGHGKIHTTDIYGRHICISGRTSKAIRIGYNNLLNTINKEPLRKTVISNKNNRMHFLRDTITIVVAH